MVAQLVKNLPAVQETQIQSLGQEDAVPGERNGKPLQYSCLENPMDRGPWWDEFHGVKKSRAFQFVNTSNFIFPVFFSHMFSLVISAVD